MVQWKFVFLMLNNHVILHVPSKSSPRFKDLRTKDIKYVIVFVDIYASMGLIPLVKYKKYVQIAWWIGFLAIKMQRKMISQSFVVFVYQASVKFFSNVDLSDELFILLHHKRRLANLHY